MPTVKLEKILAERLGELGRSGRCKAVENVFTGILLPRDGKGPRYLLEREGDRGFLVVEMVDRAEGTALLASCGHDRPLQAWTDRFRLESLAGRHAAVPRMVRMPSARLAASHVCGKPVSSHATQLSRVLKG
jgi:hypothetical protein